MRLLFLAAIAVGAIVAHPPSGVIGAPPRAGAPHRAITSEQIDERIARYRTAEAALTVTDAAGKPLANAAITVRQVRHKFLFGCNAYMLGRCRTAEENEAYRRRFAALLNYATLPFYWGAYEAREGQTRREEVAAAARWCRDHRVRAKGHPLSWHEVVPRWLEGRKPEEVASLQFGRITREVTDFAGLIDTWDVVNEAVVMPDYRAPNAISRLCRQRGQVGLITETFGLARKANPRATLILNDFNTSPKYEDLIRQCLQAGVPIDVIGIQSHMHVGCWGAAKVWEVCERFARLGKPLHFTEATILSGALKTDSDWQSQRPDWDTTPEGEKRQAEQAVEFYRVLFSHPAVEAITWWDFSDQGAWQGAPAGLVRKDMTPKPAYEALLKLVAKDWWTGPVTLTTDAAGQVRFRGFLGDYAAEGEAGQGTFSLPTAGDVAVTLTLGKPLAPEVVAPPMSATQPTGGTQSGRRP
jgi:endo-1,4-beta-xylanase